jgi:type I restriction enzyme S subunit
VFLGIGNITEGGHLDLRDIRYIAEKDYPQWTRRVTPRPGDIVFTYEATLNRYAIIPPSFRGCLGRRLALIRPNPEKVDTRFLYYQFFGKDWRRTVAENTILGATVDRIPLARFPGFPITLPPLPVQKRIATILSAYDDLIENNTRRIKILEEMAQAIYREWFVHFRFPGHKKVRLVNSPLGPIPESWEAKKLGEVCDIVMGQSPKSEFYNEQGEGLPFHQGVTDFGPHFPIDRVYSTMQNRIAEAGDILFSVRAPVGRINVTLKRIVIGRGLCAIRNRQGHQVFTLHQLKERFAEEDTMGGGTIFKAVTKDDVQGIDFLQPTDQTIHAFEERCRPLDKLIELLTQKNVNLRTTRDLLLPRLISGELDVSDLDINVGDAAA